MDELITCRACHGEGYTVCQVCDGSGLTASDEEFEQELRDRDEFMDAHPEQEID
jgi:DnaJ-class molecular chaperone